MYLGRLDRSLRDPLAASAQARMLLSSCGLFSSAEANTANVTLQTRFAKHPR